MKLSHFLNKHKALVQPKYHYCAYIVEAAQCYLVYLRVSKKGKGRSHCLYKLRLNEQNNNKAVRFGLKL